MPDIDRLRTIDPPRDDRALGEVFCHLPILDHAYLPRDAVFRQPFRSFLQRNGKLRHITFVSEAETCGRGLDRRELLSVMHLGCSQLIPQCIELVPLRLQFRLELRLSSLGRVHNPLEVMQSRVLFECLSRR